MSAAIKMEPVKAYKIYTPSELQELLGIGKNAVYELLKSGAIESFRVGKHWRVTHDALDAFIKAGGTTSLKGK